ncbi:hypothetical protein Fuma_03037 [Fuerstiella marisgermanici]|uniref:Uncharacterized protein n=1 Tax=Fuerstiella marisgermanici TaxID=1891926 RepID=A0A1P8WHA4_9PLAN|nr:hypothetical protein Fuma_03037 [Fuerstiella marisgermanici]
MLCKMPVPSKLELVSATERSKDQDDSDRSSHPGKAKNDSKPEKNYCAHGEPRVSNLVDTDKTSATYVTLQCPERAGFSSDNKNGSLAGSVHPCIFSYLIMD